VRSRSRRRPRPGSHAGGDTRRSPPKRRAGGRRRAPTRLRALRRAAAPPRRRRAAASGRSAMSAMGLRWTPARSARSDRAVARSAAPGGASGASRMVVHGGTSPRLSATRCEQDARHRGRGRACRSGAQSRRRDSAHQGAAGAARSHAAGRRRGSSAYWRSARGRRANSAGSRLAPRDQVGPEAGLYGVAADGRGIDRDDRGPGHGAGRAPIGRQPRADVMGAVRGLDGEDGEDGDQNGGDERATRGCGPTRHATRWL